MSMNFVFDSALEDTAKRLCYEYWSYASPSNYIAHLELLCYDHNTETDVLFATLAKCQVYLDEPPRLYRRVIYLSQAAMPDRVKLS